MNPRRSRTIPGGFVALAAWACGPAPRPPDASIADVEIGSGQEEFEALDRDGGTIELIYGPQGGFHVWARVQTRGLQPDLEVGYRAHDVATGRELHGTQWSHQWIADGRSYGLAPAGLGVYVSRAEQVVLAIRCADEIVGRDLLLETEVVERSTGRRLLDRRQLRVRDLIPSPDCVSDRDR